jgi:hypothetical protein
MASKTTQSANDIVNWMARNVAPSWAGATILYASMHTGAVGLGGDQTTNEVSYPGYARQPILRNNVTGEYATAVGGSTSNLALIQFGNATAGGGYPITLTNTALGENPTGAGTVIATGALASGTTINLNSNPQFPIGQLVWSEQ